MSDFEVNPVGTLSKLMKLEAEAKAQADAMEKPRVKVNPDNYDKRHGGPFDRGSADAYYRRNWDPHYYVGGTRTSDRVERADMTEQEMEDYRAGWDYQHDLGEYKEW